MLPVGAASAVALPSATRPFYLALGDSLAVGVGANRPEQQGYVPRVSRFLRPAHLANLAQEGETSTSFRAGQLQAASVAIADPTTDVQVVTLNIGANELLNLLATGPCALNPASADCRLAIQATLTSFAQNYSVILGTLQQALVADEDGGHLLVMTYYNPWTGTGSPQEAIVDAALLGSDGTIDCNTNPAVDGTWGLNDLITCLGRLHGAIVVDVYSLYQDRAPVGMLIAEDNLHPTTAGHAVIAQGFKDAIKQLREK